MLFEIWNYEFYIHQLRKECQSISIKNMSYMTNNKVYFINLYFYRIVLKIYK